MSPPLPARAPGPLRAVEVARPPGPAVPRAAAVQAVAGSRTSSQLSKSTAACSFSVCRIGSSSSSSSKSICRSVGPTRTSAGAALSSSGIRISCPYSSARYARSINSSKSCSQQATGSTFLESMASTSSQTIRSAGLASATAMLRSLRRTGRQCFSRANFCGTLLSRVRSTSSVRGLNAGRPNCFPSAREMVQKSVNPIFTRCAPSLPPHFCCSASAERSCAPSITPAFTSKSPSRMVSAMQVPVPARLRLPVSLPDLPIVPSSDRQLHRECHSPGAETIHR